MGELFVHSGNFLAGDQAQFIYWVLALTGTIVFSIIGIITLMGFGGIEDAADLDSALDAVDHLDTGFLDFKLLTFKSILAFVTIFGWSGVVWGRHGWFGFIAALIAGGIMMVLTALLFWMILRLQHSGNVKHRDFIGKKGSVYLGIPADRSGAGKVTVEVANSTFELNALSDEAIPTGVGVEIVEDLGDRRFLVKKI